MKRSLKTFGLILASLFVMPFAVSAATTTYEDIPNGSYVIGKHIFTRESGSLTVKKIMLASGTIETDNADDMQIIYKDIMGNLKEVSNGKDEDTNQYPDAEVELTDVINYEYYDLVLQISDELTKKGKNLTNEYYNKYENEEFNLNDDEFNEDLYYIKIGKYSKAIPSEISINGNVYTTEDKRMGIGKNSWLEAPVWKIEDKILYISAAWLIAESLPEDLTEVLVGTTKYDIKVFPENVSENVLTVKETYKLNVVEDATFNIAKEGNNIAVESSDGRHMVGVTLSLNGEDLLDTNDVIYSLADDGTLSISSPTAIETILGDSTNLQMVTYATYPAYNNGKYTEQEEKTVLHKIAIPGKGVIRLNFNLTPVNAIKYTDGVIASAPRLGNLVPIKHNGEEWVYADVYEEWYNYSDTKDEWANAVVLASGVSKTVGDSISEEEIDVWFVWVPRYEYKLPADSIGTTGSPKAIDINFISSDVTVPTEGYAFHPGFAWDSDWSNGISEWKDGIWIGKFESTADNPSSDNLQKIKIKANVEAWKSVNVYRSYNSSWNLDSDYGIIDLYSHQTRYTEWTAISYLTNSIYGRCSDLSTCAEVTRNDNDSYITGDGDYKINVDQSTTGNITGIYDMSGGVSEYVMGYLSGSKGKSAFVTLPTNHKFEDVFTLSDTSSSKHSAFTGINGTTSMNGVFGEMLLDKNETLTWFNDFGSFITSGMSWFALGGYNNSFDRSGVFASLPNHGGAHGYHGFRVALS